VTALLTDEEIREKSYHEAPHQTLGFKAGARFARDFYEARLAEDAKEIEELKRKLKEAVGDAAILASAYSTDSRPPTNVVVRSTDRGKKALGK